MFMLEELKRTVEKVTGRGRPAPREARDTVRDRKPRTFKFKDDGLIPNNPALPFIFYRSPVRLVPEFDPAAIFEQLFDLNGWGDAWRNGIYDYVHYHSRIHEVLGIARGRALVQFGGRSGRKVEVKAGDVAILPAGTGHQCLGASKDLLVVGAYPATGAYDECRASKKEHERALVTIPKVALPRKDPIYGRDGPLLRLWQKQ